VAKPVPLRARLALPSKAIKILFAGLLLREALSFWTGHPFDFESFIRTGYVVSHGENPYVSFWPPVPGVSFAGLTYTLPSAAYLPFWSALLGELYRLWSSVGGGNRFLLYFILKQPGIWADVGVAYLLFRLTERWTANPASALRVLSFWSFFPYAIVISAIWGQFDAIIVLVLLGLLLARSSFERNILYGIGIFAKWLTVIFLPFDVFRERRWRRLGFVIALAIPAILTLLVFVAEGWSFRGIFATGVSQSHGEPYGMNYAYLLTFSWIAPTLAAIPGFYTYGPYVWVPGVVVAGWLAATRFRASGPSEELRALLLILTVFLLLRWGLSEQYMPYLFSLLALDIAAFHPERRAFFRFTYAFSMLWLLINNYLGLVFLYPLSPSFQTYTTNMAANVTWTDFQTCSLLVLSIVATLTFFQLAGVAIKDQDRPVPWLLRLPKLLARAFAQRVES
jgi:hypothetical protein